MVVNKFMCDNIMIKNKTLPLYEQNGIYNLKKRKYKNIDTLMEYNMRTQVLTKNVRCGNLWDTIKGIFKKGKKFAKDAINYIDKSPLLNTVKDIGFDYIQEKTGVNPNDYYNVARDVVNSDTNTNIQKLTDAASKTLMDTYKQQKEKRKNIKPGVKSPTKKEQLKDFMKDYSTNLIKQIPEQKETITQNVSKFASGIDEISSGSINLDVWKKKAPLFLLSKMSKTASGKCGNKIDDTVKEFLKKVYKFTDFRLPPTMKKILEKGATGDASNGRLYQGKGDSSEGRLHQGVEEESKGRLNMGGKKSNDKYAKLLAALK